jgi:nicotinate phosphoribosyltransferase
MNAAETTTQESLYQRYMAFPEIPYQDFLSLPEDLRRTIVQRNRILQTDTYNRTMGHIKGPEWKTPETYILQMRRAHEGYLIAHGIRAQIEKIARMKISPAEFTFAKEFYATANVPFFNEEMWRYIIEDCEGNIPLKIDAVPDGTAMRAGDPVIRVSGPGEVAAHFEPDFHRVFYESLVATTAHEIATKIGAERFIEVGKRGTPNEETHLQAAAAMYAGGGISLTSNDAAAACYPQLKDVGTLGHRFIQFYDTEEASYREAIERTNATSLLIDLTDSYRGINKALELKEEYRETGKKIWIRLDSGNILEQVIYALGKFKELGFDDAALDKVVVEDISTVDEMVAIDEAVAAAGFDAKKHVLYGAGGLLVTKMKGRSDASTGYKLSGVERDGELVDKIKFSDSPGKESLPGAATLTNHNGQREIAKVGEYPEAEDLMVPAYRNGEILFTEDATATRERVRKSFAEISAMTSLKTPKSEQIRQSTRELALHYEVQLAA